MLFSMSQSLSCVLIHIVFSTKDRAPILDSSVRPALNGYLATVARNLGCECFRVGVVADHVHLALRMSRTVTTAQLVEELKTSSYKWLKTQSTALAAFAWQGGLPEDCLEYRQPHRAKSYNKIVTTKQSAGAATGRRGIPAARISLGRVAVH
jgi:REP element-mobilizing transposase RayT